MICVDLFEKYPLLLETLTTIGTLTGWFQMVKQYEKISISISELFEQT